jgi:glucuronokinase
LIIIRKRAFSRAALLGNPSDGYQGRTLSAIVGNCCAEVVLYEWDSMDIVPSENDRARFRSIHDFVRDVELHGYYGGIRLIKGTIKRFVEYCESRGIRLHGQNFSIRYQTNIPQQVGMAGSSAIIIAALRALMEFYGVSIPIEAQPSLALSVEKEKLGIMGGLQDRVAQVYEGLVYMDFDPKLERATHGLKCYHYEPLPTDLLPPLYVAHHNSLSEPTEVFHNDIRGRFNRGEKPVVDAMRELGEITVEGRAALLRRDYATLGGLINANFDVRRRISNLPPWQVRMVEVARDCGATANFAGSGGAIIGTCEDERMFRRLSERMAEIGSRVVRPEITGGQAPV